MNYEQLYRMRCLVKEILKKDRAKELLGEGSIRSEQIDKEACPDPMQVEYHLKTCIDCLIPEKELKDFHKRLCNE